MSASRRVRLAFVGGEHVHFPGLLTSALASPTAEVVGLSISDAELRQYFAHLYPEVPTFAALTSYTKRPAPRPSSPAQTTGGRPQW